MSEAFSRIYYAKPSITDLEVRYATDAATTGWGENCYAYIDKFEQDFADYLGIRHALATSSATGALHLGLMASGIGPGDEVILADTNWIASVAPVVLVGATPVFVDVLQDTWCIDPALVESAITAKTKAIIAVHLYGNLCDMGTLEKIAQKHGLLLIEDAAEALGSRWGGRHAGTRGTFGFFSFHGTKTLTTGEGGMIVTNDDSLYYKVKTLNNHGRKPDEIRQFWASCIGTKYKMSNIQAAIGCAQLQRINELVARKKEIFAYYHAKLCSLPGVSMNPVPHGDEVYGYWMPTLVLGDNGKRDAILNEFKRQNIDGRIFFHPLSSLPMFENRPENIISYNLAHISLNLPSYHDLTRDELDRVVDIILKTCNPEAP